MILIKYMSKVATVVTNFAKRYIKVCINRIGGSEKRQIIIDNMYSLRPVFGIRAFCFWFRYKIIYISMSYPDVRKIFHLKISQVLQHKFKFVTMD